MEKSKLSPFDFITSVSHSKTDLIETKEDEAAYNAYMVNRGLSYFQDTILYANEMNLRHALPKDAQYRYYLNVLRPRKRFSKWFKAEKSETLDLIQSYYNCNRLKAKTILKLLSTEDLENINKTTNKGGTNN